ncbi:MAG: hypothetical protein H6631_16850 [Anaerolineaceae bacterium]|nr:hypothetical protein [Anaerolineaceae bacterium]
MSRRDDIQTLIGLYNRRLQKLNEQAALKGFSTPPEISLEIEDIEAQLAGLQAELDGASAQLDTPLTDAELTRELTRLSSQPPPSSSSTQIGGFNLSNVSGSTITIGNVSANVNAGGDIVGGNKITTHITAGAGSPVDVQAQLTAALAQWRVELEAQIATLSNLDDDEKDELKEKADKVQQEAAKGEAANPGKLERLLNSMSAMAPDILEVTVTTLQNPFAGVGLVLKKISDRIKVERAG